MVTVRQVGGQVRGWVGGPSENGFWLGYFVHLGYWVSETLWVGV